MRKKLCLYLLAFISFKTIQAQDTIRLKDITKDPKSERFKVVTDRAPQTVFAELLGAGILFSIHYDRRFEKRTDGFGFRAGLSAVVPDESRGFVYVLGINHLVGNNKKGRFFESGINFTNYSYKSTFNNSRYNESLISLTLGYRSQPITGGFCFRGGINPIYIDDVFIPYPYLSFGFNF